MKRLRSLFLLVFLLVCAGSFWYAQRGAGRVSSTEEISVKHGGSAFMTAVPPQSVELSVLNGCGQPALARRFSRKLAALGCVIVSVADAPHDSFPTSLIINRRLPREHAELLAARLGGVDVLMEWDQRGHEDAVLVLGHDHGRLLDRTPTGP